MLKCSYKVKKVTLWRIISFPSEMVHITFIFCIISRNHDTEIYSKIFKL